MRNRDIRNIRKRLKKFGLHKLTVMEFALIGGMVFLEKLELLNS